MFITATGSCKSNREMAEDIAQYALQHLAPRLLSKVEIDIKLINNLKEKEEVAGD